MTGGYLESDNEEKVSKTIYIIKKDGEESNSNNQISNNLQLEKRLKIYSMGKTNKILFTGVN